MPWSVAKKNKQFCIFKEGADGKPSGETLGCHDSREEANKQLAALYASEGKSLTADELKSIKCWDEYPASAYVPWGITTLKDALAAQEAQENAAEIQQLGSLYNQIVNNILGSPEVGDKASAITSLAGELAAQLQDEVTADTEDQRLNGMGGDLADKSLADHMALKSLGNNRVGSYAVLWGTEEKRDLTGEFFDRETQELTAVFDAVGKLPFIYHHGLDEEVKTKVIGVVDVLKADTVGLWYEAQLKLADEYDAYIKKMLDDQKLKTSSQTFAVARRVNQKSGHIERWPIVEITATPAPAEHRMPAIEVLKSAYDEIGADGLSDFLKRYSESQGAEKARAQLAIQRLRLAII
jgi:hypothetical protein